MALFSHWEFDEEGDALVVRDSSEFASADITLPNRLTRTRGVHGAALDLVGENKLACKFASDATQLSGITIAAWARPTDLRGYREIFRQECDERLLFSYQSDGCVLSLGLNIGGYVECDARIEPDQLMDGAWHHCAATFDGQAMRVYLDGKEIGSFAATRPDRPADFCTCFHRFQQRAGRVLSRWARRSTHRAEGPNAGTKISRLYRNGIESLVSYAEQFDAELGTLYAPRQLLCRTLAGTCKNLAERDRKRIATW
ncbi:MAG: LamG domain-containing protein [Pirellulaceae bacterium]